MMILINYLILIIAVLINVAFITLLERKVLGYSQMRKGPNKVSMGGILQPFNDAIKLFSKEMIYPLSSNRLLFIMAPTMAITLSLTVFFSLLNINSTSSGSLTILIIFMILSMNIYPTLLAGWSSNSKYAMIGSLRAIAQTISYEVSLALIFLFFIIPSSTLSWGLLSQEGLFWSKLPIYLPVVGLWLVSCFAETNRTPFDFAEGESELVSGFNIEYGSVGFALIFMAEYGSIYFMSTFFVFFFFSLSPSGLSSFILVSGLVFIWIWVRTTLPRYRFDLLMNMAWKSYLPAVLLLSFYSIALIF